ncbi:hypothetical protein GCM10025862_13270 [Arsenicicoccus piscis]|uniref:Prolipoprotein diacylglyceryl transferase n=1 Tax=Arsenicicoccus piscis TaxID=673954 RepID=A0ABQ6HLR7_9MICO|nr:hypothetical protein GCM10025862_13270 [Arsenicicoccus piscis]
MLAHLPGLIPSPTQGVWWLGPLPARAYALCILAGIFVALIMTRRRLEARGGTAEQVDLVAFWAVPFGIVGAGSTTSSRPTSPTSGPVGTRSTRSRSGRAGSASGAPWRSGRSGPGSAAAATGWT